MVYPEAVARLPGAPAWAVLFFLMLVLLAVDSQFLMVQTVIISLTDEFEQRLCKHRKKVIAAVCAAIYVLGLPMVCQVRREANFCLCAPTRALHLWFL